MEITKNEAQTQERLPWHKPEVQRLVVSFDTLEGTLSSGEIGPDGVAP